MKLYKLLASLARSQQGVRFTDLERLLYALGFELSRTNGSHHIFRHPKVNELVNVQNVAGEAKPYQVRQFLSIVERYGLTLPGGQS